MERDVNSAESPSRASTLKQNAQPVSSLCTRCAFAEQGDVSFVLQGGVPLHVLYVKGASKGAISNTAATKSFFSECCCGEIHHECLSGLFGVDCPACGEKLDSEGYPLLCTTVTQYV